MIGWILLGLAGAGLAGTAVVGLAGRMKRAGFRKGVLAPAWKVGPWFAVGLGALFFIVTWSLAGLLAGLAAGALLFLAALGWDEFSDRACPAFYACFRREVYGFFATPIPYFVLFLFTMMSGVFFWEGLDRSRLLTLRPSFGSIAFLGFFLFPLLTMGLLARERSEGTIEVLMTAPVSDSAVAVSKFLATMTFYLAMLLPTAAYYAVMKHIGEHAAPPVSVDVGPVLTGLAGMILMGAFFAAMGLMASSFTSSQILAALLTWVLIVVFLILGMVSRALGFTGTTLGGVLESIETGHHLDQFLKGVIDPKEVIYFLSFTVFFLFIAVRSLESRKWR